MHCLRNRQDTCGQRCVGKGGWKSFFPPASPVVVGNTAAQTVFGHWLIRIGWKERFIRFSLAVCQILLQDGDHIGAKG